MVEQYDKNFFEIKDLYDIYLAEYEECCKEYKEKYEYWDADEEGYELETPEESRKRIFGDLKRGKKYILVKYKGNAEEAEIPAGVTNIGSYAFAKNLSLRSVFMPDTVTEIGGSVFAGCTSLERVRLSEKLNAIGREQFKDCTSLRSIEVPDSVKVLRINCFDGCSALEDVKLGKNLELIGWDAFSRCKSLKTVVLPESLLDIDLNVFYDSGIEEIYIPKNVKSINSSAFIGCRALKKIEVAPENPYYYSRDNCVYLTQNKWLVVGRNDGTLPNDESLTLIDSDAFEGNLSVEDLYIPRGVKSICYSAFKGCKNLRRLTLPDTLTTICRCAFEGCSSLEEVVIPGSVKVIEGLSFYQSGVKKVVIKRGVEMIDDKAFYKCENLQEIYIPSSVKNVYTPIGYKFEPQAQTVRVFVEVDKNKNYEKWIGKLDGFNVTLLEKPEIFD